MKYSDYGHKPGERRNKTNIEKRSFHKKILTMPWDKALFVVLDESATPINAKVLDHNYTEEEAFDQLKLVEHNHCGESIHKFLSIDELHNNNLF
ncbi:hypothetical protein ACFLY2_01220 [Patescibacteria group bacterium]